MWEFDRIHAMLSLEPWKRKQLERDMCDVWSSVLTNLQISDGIPVDVGT